MIGAILAMIEGVTGAVHVLAVFPELVGNRGRRDPRAREEWSVVADLG